jgi:glycogen synthase
MHSPPDVEAALRVLMVSPRFPPDVGGVESHVYELARRLVARDTEVTVLTTDRSRSLPAREIVQDVRVRRVYAWPRRKDYYLSPAIVSEVRRSACDVMHLHSHHTFVAPLAMSAAIGRGLPFVVTFHGLGHTTGVRGRFRPVQAGLLRPMLGRAGRLIALTTRERDLFARLLRLPVERFVVIPSGGDRLLAARQGTSSSRDGPVIASIGRLEWYKGHHRLVAALPRVLENYPDARLVIVGVGPAAGRLREIAAAAGVAGRVSITTIPYTNVEAMAAVVEQASLVALLSDGEGQPLSVLEAASLGRPVLVSEAPGLQELIDARLAAGVSLNASSHEVAEAVIRQLRQPLLPNAASISTWDSCVDGLLEVYAAITGEGAARNVAR